MSSAFRTTDVRGRRLRYICEGDGPVAVVIDQGQGLSIEQGFERIAWSELQGDLLGLSAMSTQVIATHAGHLIQFGEPGLVADAIRGVVRDAQIGPDRIR
jgi:hypothetical protein